MQNAAIYIVTNKRNGTLYTGVTSNLSYRIAQHKAGIYDSFSRQFGCTILVYYEEFLAMDMAIKRETELKALSRREQIALIEEVNPDWKDLYMNLLQASPQKENKNAS